MKLECGGCSEDSGGSSEILWIMVSEVVVGVRRYGVGGTPGYVRLGWWKESKEWRWPWVCNFMSEEKQ